MRQLVPADPLANCRRVPDSSRSRCQRSVVYDMCMGRTNIDVDAHACAIVMRRYGLPTKRAAVNFALRQLAAEISLQTARGLRGSGWDGDLAELRSTRDLPS
jgi:Arc/MetJ family transcription regulator